MQASARSGSLPSGDALPQTITRMPSRGSGVCPRTAVAARLKTASWAAGTLNTTAAAAAISTTMATTA
jgi:hypothetical protein